MATIVVQHQITDAETFFSKTEDVVGNAPEGVRARQFCPSEDHSRAVCVWEGGSLDAVRAYVDSLSEGISENTYYAVDEQNAFGLPEQAPASA